MLKHEQIKKLLHGAILYQDDYIIGRISVCRRTDYAREYDCVYFCQEIEAGSTIATETLGFTKFKILDPLDHFVNNCNTLIVELGSNNKALIEYLNDLSQYVFNSYDTVRRAKITGIILQHQATLYDFV